MLVNICKFLTNRRRENKEHFAKPVYTSCRLVIIIPNHGINANLSTLDHTTAAITFVSLAMSIHTKHEIEVKCCQSLHNNGGFFRIK